MADNITGTRTWYDPSCQAYNPPFGCFQNVSFVEDEAFLRDQLALLQEHYVRDAKSLLDRIAAIEVCKPQKPIVITRILIGTGDVSQ